MIAERENTKKSYTSPALIEWGSITAITRGTGGGDTDAPLYNTGSET